MRFTMKGDTLYAFLMAWPESRGAVVKSLATNSPQIEGRKVAEVSLAGLRRQNRMDAGRAGAERQVARHAAQRARRGAEDQRRHRVTQHLFG